MSRRNSSCLSSLGFGACLAFALAGCVADVGGDRNDLRGRAQPGAPVGTDDVLDGGAGDGGDEWQTSTREEPGDAPRHIRRAPVPVRSLDCNDPCPTPCSVDEICCHASRRCVPIDCIECCSDGRQGHAIVRPVGR